MRRSLIIITICLMILSCQTTDKEQTPVIIYPYPEVEPMKETDSLADKLRKTLEFLAKIMKRSKEQDNQIRNKVSYEEIKNTSEEVNTSN